jgi:rhodanese-related sulfurtransferase
MDHRDLKTLLYTQFARIGKALASPARLELLDLLAQGERPVEGLAQEAHLSIANASSHLQVLAGARLVAQRRDGSRVYYRLADASVYTLWAALRDTATAQLAELDRLVETYLADRRTLEPISRDELLRRLADGDTIVVDVRPTLEYRQGHIAGADSVPVDELERRLDELDPHREIVAYCRGPYCVFADDAVALLRARGRKAARYVEGYPEWAAAGLPIARDEVATGRADEGGDSVAMP